MVVPLQIPLNPIWCTFFHKNVAGNSGLFLVMPKQWQIRYFWCKEELWFSVAKTKRAHFCPLTISTRNEQKISHLIIYSATLHLPENISSNFWSYLRSVMKKIHSWRNINHLQILLNNCFSKSTFTGVTNYFWDCSIVFGRD